MAQEDMMAIHEDVDVVMTEDVTMTQEETSTIDTQLPGPPAVPNHSSAFPSKATRRAVRAAQRRKNGHQPSVGGVTKQPCDGGATRKLRRPRRKTKTPWDISGSPSPSPSETLSSEPPSSEPPALEDDPHRYPDCCLTLSNRLIQSLTNILNSTDPIPEPNLVLSIGSGSGRLETHLQSHWLSTPSCDLEIRGVEIRTPDDARPVNRWLPEQYYSTVQGTWQLSSDLQSAGALMFVYPRDPALISRYMLAAAQDQHSPLRTLVWLGPRADWPTFEDCLCGTPGFERIQFVEDCGMVQYEMMVVVRKAPPVLFSLPSHPRATEDSIQAQSGSMA